MAAFALSRFPPARWAECPPEKITVPSNGCLMKNLLPQSPAILHVGGRGGAPFPPLEKNWPVLDHRFFNAGSPSKFNDRQVWGSFPLAEKFPNGWKNSPRIPINALPQKKPVPPPFPLPLPRTAANFPALKRQSRHAGKIDPQAQPLWEKSPSKFGKGNRMMAFRLFFFNGKFSKLFWKMLGQVF